MEQTGGRRGSAEKISPADQVIYDEFKPSFDWSHVLCVDLPGFKKEEVTLQVDNLGRATVSGERRVTKNRSRRFKQEFSLPKDSDIEKISDEFDSGRLFIRIPEKAVPRMDDAKDKEGAKEDKEDKKHEKPDLKEKPKKDDKPGHGRDVREVKKKESKRNKEQEGMKGEEKKEESKRKGEKEERKRDEEKKEESKRNGDKEGIIRKIEETRWNETLQLGVMEMYDNMRDKLCRNKGIVVTAVIAFSVGFFISQKIRSARQ